MTGNGIPETSLTPEEVEYDPTAYQGTLEQVIAGLQARFGRLPTDQEVYRFIWGQPHVRQRIWDNKGLPAGLD